jgi:CDP-diacylglycerol pyrophosphatase
MTQLRKAVLTGCLPSRRRVGRFKGVLQVDGYGGYRVLSERDDAARWLIGR